jgi:parallel beta-helix repeat protein
MCRKLQSKCLTLTFFGLAAVLLLTVSPARALIPVAACGQTLDVPGGKYILTVDLDCSGTLANGINITASSVFFHLAGHTISSTDCDPSKGIGGIVVSGGISGVRIDGGTVRGFDDGVVLYSSSSRMSGMTVTNACVFGIAVSGQNNRVDTSVVTLSGLDGIGIGAASGTYIVSNDISGNARVGVDISNFSNNNFVMDNIINSNGILDGEQGGVAIFNGTNNLVANNALNHNFNGIEIESPGNLVRGNTVNGSHTGIFITTVGSPSTVKNNTVLGSVIADMSDDTCGVNTWRNNTFQTDLVAGVSDGGPGTGCIR